MVSESALARKQRFIDLKKEHGGDVDGIKQYYENLDWNLWHEEDGTIVSMSKEPNEELSSKFDVARFSNEQIAILTDKNWNLYKIIVDKHNKHVKYIQVRPVEIDKVSSEEFFLYQIDNHTNRVYDVKIVLSPDKFSVVAHANLIKQYNDIDLSNAIINGRKVLPFYITTKNDPSFLLQTINISLEDLIRDKMVTVDLSENLIGSSVFTLKLFDKYSFVEEIK